MSSQVKPEPAFVKFQTFHQPTLADGDYTITVTQKVEIDKPVGEFTATRNFTVAGERFELKPTDVESVFPPDGNLGDHTNVLPHIILDRSTLPWERTITGEQNTGIPWLMLLLFDENQTPKPETKTVADLLKPAGKGDPRFPTIKMERAQQPTDVLTVIDVPKSVLAAMMPTVEELKLLTHVRSATTANDELAGDEIAIIIANRLPERGKTSTAHLVSVEGRFKKIQGKYEFDYKGAYEGEEVKDSDLIRLVSLKGWSFTCQSREKSFRQLLLGLNSTPSTLRLPQGTSAAEKIFSKGYVVVPHYFRAGDETVSWFRGPLIPSQNLTPEMDQPAAMNLPARTADELVHYDPELSMFDVSYAAAWELGRLLALQDKDFSTSLYQWKRRQAQRNAQRDQRLANLHVPFLKVSAVPFPKDIFDWFESLRLLNGVPFNYLAPDERMLPAESIRFFRLDQAWVDCLTDGAFSIGRVASSDHKADKLLGSESPVPGFVPTTGFLLRSEVVSGWPGLLVAGFPDQTTKTALPVRRMERLSAGVLLCLFDGEIARVEIYQKPETLHFGLGANGGFFKKLRDESGKVRDTWQVDLSAGDWISASQRIINITAFADSIKKKLAEKLEKDVPPLTSAQFGLQMMEGGEKIIFRSVFP